MSEPLPDDISRWPKDPFEILGIPRDADAKAIKRAYTQLLRRFKPEHAPQHFQKLRTAYETATERAAWHERYRSHAESEADDDDAEPLSIPTDAEAETEPSSSPWTARRSQPRVDPVELAWREANEGQSEQAYRRLTEWHRGENGDCASEPWKGYTQLYWLLTLDPALAVDEAAADWLTMGLTKTGAAWPLIELFSREVARDPHEAFRPQVEQLLQAASPSLLTTLLNIRWQAASQLGNRQIIFDELEKFRPRISYDHAASWGQLVITALEQCALAMPDHRGLSSLVAELESTSYAEQFSVRLDRLDLLLAIAKRWHELEESNVPRRWIGLIRDCHSLTDEETQRRWEEIVSDIARQPLRSVYALDMLQQDHPLAAIMFCEQLERYCRQRGVHIDQDVEFTGEVPVPAALVAAVRRFRSYEGARRELIEWSLGEHLPLAQCVWFLDQITGVDLSAAIAQDRSYSHVFAAWQVFWGK